MKIVNFIFYALWLIVLAVLQTTVVQWIGIFNITPNLIFVFVILGAFVRGKAAGALCGAIFGLVFDLMTGRLIGVNMILFMYAGFFAGVLCERFINGTDILTTGIVLLVMSTVCSLVYYIAYSMMWPGIGFIKAFFRVIIPEAFYTAVIGIVLKVPIQKSFKIIQRRNMF
ncbi:MAG: rod shape-determining protein MreD [Clostridia bacterium]|nr:rod shape-determining protein MreD [Clostridia bacterium]